MEANGNTHDKPPAALTVVWDDKHKRVSLQFSQAEFQTWEFVLAVLHMAQIQAEDNKRLAQMADLQRQAQQQQAVRNLLRH